jgi:pimeloyl-ACP methyl ester carboxylesterase
MYNQYDFDEYLHSNLVRSQKSEYSFLATPYGEIRYCDTGGDKPVLLTAPDGPCFIEHFEQFIEKARSNFRVIVLDMPGFGQSYPKNGYDHSFEKAASVIKILVDDLQIKDMVLSLSCGNGFYGIYFAKKYPELVKRLILIQTPSFEGMRPWLKASVPALIKVPFLGQLFVYAQRLKIPRVWFRVAIPKQSPHLEKWSALSENLISMNCCNCLASVVQGLSAMNEVDLIGCRVPTLMIWGNKDYSHRLTNKESLRKLIPHAEILSWDDCGHFPELEQTDRYLELLHMSKNS